MSGTTFLSDPYYLPLFEPSDKFSLERYTSIIRNFVKGDCRPLGIPIRERIKVWNGTIVHDVVVFSTAQDKMWFILRWS